MLNCYVLNRSDLAVKDYYLSNEYEINIDYLTNEKSSFKSPLNTNAQQGDFFLAKNVEDGTLKDVAFFGLVDSFEDDKLVATDVYSLANIDFPATRKTGNSFEVHINTLIHYYLLNDVSKAITDRLIIRIDSNTNYTYQPADPPTITNMVKYMINGFRKYNVTWEVESVEYDEENKLKINTVIKQKTKIINIKNNSYDFLNWSVYVSPAGRDSENKLLIIDKKTADSETPLILSTWYVDIDGNITQSNASVRTPTKTKIFIYDNTPPEAGQEDNRPSFQEVANSELSYSLYSHEIEFDLKKENNLLNPKDLEIGLKVNIMYDGVLYPSILTGYIIDNKKSTMHLKCGNIRSTLADILD